MDVSCQQFAGFCGPRMGRASARHRLRAVLCLLAFAIQLVVPVVHMWEVAARQTEVTVTVPVLPSSSCMGDCPTALSVINERPHRLLHDAALCPVCQVLTRMRDWIGARVEVARNLTAVSWLVFFPLLPPAKCSPSAIAARAPPSFSSDALH
jgi:hypothetical protein